MIHKRHFFHVPGFDPYDAASQHRRFVRETARFQVTWNVSAVAVSDLRDPSAGEGHWTVTATGPGWKVETGYEILDWDDIVRAELAGPASRRLWHGLVTFVDFIASGTVGRYFGANWRYGMFFFVPFVSVILFAAIAIIAGWFAGDAGPSRPVLGAIVGLVVALVAFGLLMRWPGEPWRISQGLSDWIFARDYMLRRRRDVDARAEAFADRLIARARGADADEIIVAGHSLGATLLVDMLARALARDPELGKHRPKLGVLTIGATISQASRSASGGGPGARRRPPHRRGEIAGLGRVPGPRRRHQLSQIPSRGAHAFQRRQRREPARDPARPDPRNAERGGIPALSITISCGCTISS